MLLEAYACSDVGVQRSQNEDNLYLNGFVKEETAEQFVRYEKINTRKGRGVFGVFDGMGGYSKGEYASFLCADTVKDVLKNNKKGNSQSILHEAVLQSNNRVCSEIKSSGIKMGSTLAMLYFENNSYDICNVGDSPVYMIHRGELKRISVEHTEASVYEKIYGEAPPKEKKFPLTQHVGMFEQSSQMKPHYGSGIISEGDLFLICTDGLTDMLDEAEIIRIVNSSRPLADIGSILLNNAIEKGGKDNITFILLRATNVPIIEPIIELPSRKPVAVDVSKKQSSRESQQKNNQKNNNENEDLSSQTSKKETPKENTEKKASSEKSRPNVQELEEREHERKAVTIIAVGTVIFSVIVAAASFLWVYFNF